MQLQFFYIGSSNKTSKGDFYLKIDEDRIERKLHRVLLHFCMSKTPSTLVSNDATNAESYDLTAATNKITQSAFFWWQHFVDGAMVRCCGSNIGFSLLRYNLLNDSAAAIALERIDLNFKNDAKTTESTLHMGPAHWTAGCYCYATAKLVITPSRSAAGLHSYSACHHQPPTDQPQKYFWGPIISN